MIESRVVICQALTTAAWAEKYVWGNEELYNVFTRMSHRQANSEKEGARQRL
jgi:hypothetical protein